jgi:hypothetical protein
MIAAAGKAAYVKRLNKGSVPCDFAVTLFVLSTASSFIAELA